MNRRRIVIPMCLVIFGAITFPSHSIAQQKTVKACQEEWRANKAANQANGVTEKAYVAQCRGGAAPAPNAAAPASPPPASNAAGTGQKTVADCRNEWRANKIANQANGVTEKAYVAQCRGGAATAQPTTAPAAAPAPAPAPAAAPATATAAPAAPAPAARPSPTIPEGPVGANEFSTEAQAKGHCPSDTVVWVNLNSKIYHFSDTRYYGNTEHGAYMCERDATAAGMRAAKNETHP